MTSANRFPTAEDLLAGIDESTRRLLPYEYASAATVSVFTDQLAMGDDQDGADDIIGISAVVYERKLFSLSIATDWLKEPDVMSTMVNAVIAQAFYRYSQEYEQKVIEAEDFLNNHPSGYEQAVKEMRARIRELREED